MKPFRLALATAPREVRLAPGVAAPPPVPAARVEELEKAAYERGRADAEKALREQMIQQRGELAALQQGALQALKGAVGQVVRQSEALLVDLSFEVARKLVAGMPVGRELVAAAVQEALDRIDSTTEITVQLHPEDLTLFEQIPAAERPGSSLLEAIRLVASPLVQRGGCVVQTRFGVIDNQPATRLRSLKAALAE
ncbi:MAG TPA: hypothetical protein DCM86_16265 [Verrucomicrobiales bacterium]|nr:hypothetical protein [Verrucomicrobiales bacterium]